MPKSYRHLTYEERCQIEALKKSGISIGLIAEQLGRDRTTIYREIRRNSGKRGYRHKRCEGLVSLFGIRGGFASLKGSRRDPGLSHTIT